MWKKDRILTLFLLACTPMPASASEALRPALSAKCEEIAAKLKEMKETRIRIEEPIGPMSELANARPQQVLDVLKSELVKRKIDVVSEARYKLQVDYSRPRFDAGTLRALTLQMKLLDREDVSNAQAFEATVNDPLVLLRLQGMLKNPLVIPIRELATQVAKLLENQPNNKIMLSGMQGAETNCGEIAKMLLDELAQQKNSRGPIQVEIGATLRLRGTCHVKSAAQRVSLLIQLELADALGQVLGKELKIEVPLQGRDQDVTQDSDGIRTLLLAVPTTASIPPADANPKRMEKVMDRIKAPSAHVEEGVWVSPDAQSPFAVAVRVKGVLRPVILKNGQAFLDLKKDDVYEVLLRSKLPYDTAASLHVDSLSMFAFSANRGYTHVILPRGQKDSVSLTGWHRSNSKVDLFQVVPLKDSPAAKLIRSGTGIGTIVVEFAAAWDKHATPPPDELHFRVRSSRGERLGTGRGPESGASFQEVERIIGVPRACVTIRYTRDE